MSSPDILLALVTFLKSDPDVSALCGTDIYDVELPQDESFQDLMPIKTVVIRKGGGTPKLGGGTIPISDPRLTVICYGETAHLASVVDDNVRGSLKEMDPQVINGTYVHWVTLATYGIDLRDPDTHWPYVVSTWKTLFSDLTVT